MRKANRSKASFCKAREPIPKSTWSSPTPATCPRPSPAHLDRAGNHGNPVRPDRQRQLRRRSGDGYLEMWNHFPNGGAYFSKTLGDSGPMGGLRGSSSWRPFSLPFMSDAKTGTPSRLEFNLVLPGPGTVKLGDLRLVQYPDGIAAVSSPRAWWSNWAAVWIGAVGGTIIGCLGALIGTLAGLGLARRFVLYPQPGHGCLWCHLPGVWRCSSVGLTTLRSLLSATPERDCLHFRVRSLVAPDPAAVPANRNQKDGVHGRKRHARLMRRIG